MWRVYYDDGTTWDWKKGLEDIPLYGVLCILQYVETDKGVYRYHIVYGSQYYMHAQDQWLHAYESDVIDYVQHHIPIDQVLIGRMTTKKIFLEVYEKAKQDKDLENLD